MTNESNPVASTNSAPVDPANADAELAVLQSKVSAPSSGTLNASSKVPNNIEGLRKEAPEVYKAMLEGIAQTILSRMRKHDKEMKKLMREGYRGKQ